ncbi:MAG: hypothetical protein H6636_04560 [Anaerolineales bacterium]|nr:hypothetical protein [Anaerolineales bacterium]
MSDNLSKISLLFSFSRIEKTAFLSGLAGLTFLNSFNLSSFANLTFCPSQALFPAYLTARESLQWTAALWGTPNEARLHALLAFLELSPAQQKTPLSQLPTSTLRALHWLAALLPKPEVILVDDLATGLSPPAKRQLWQLIRTTHQKYPCPVFYATQDQEAIRALAAEIWLLDGEQVTARYRPENLPEGLRTATGYAFTLNTPRATKEFLAGIANLPAVQNANQRTPRTIDVWVQESKALVDLTWQAGFDLESFRTLPQTEIPFSLPEKDNPSQSPFALRQALRQHSPTQRPAPPVWPAIRILGLNEWRGHFRSFWKYGNLLFTGIYLLLVLSGTVRMFSTPDNFIQLAPLFLLFSATLSVGLGLEAVNRLGSVGEEATLFHPARPLGADRPLSRLALYDLSPTPRSTILAGLGLGQFLLLLIHNWPLLFFVWGVQEAFPRNGLFLAASLGFWGLAALFSFSSAVWLGSQLPRPGWGIPLGWLGWLLAVMSGYGLATWGTPLTWLWPFAGLTAAFQHLAQPAQMWLPLMMAMPGIFLMGWMAWRAFCTRPAVWKKELFAKKDTL